MSRFTRRLSSRKAWSAIIAASILAASAAVVTTTTLAQNRPDRGSNGNGFDRRDRGNGYGNNNGQQGDRSRRFGNNGNYPAGDNGSRPAPQSPQAAPAATLPSPASSTSQPTTDPAATETAAALPPPPPQDLVRLKPSDYSTKYTLLERKNIFLKGRRPVVGPGSPGYNNPGDNLPPRRPEELQVLRGISLQEGRRVAFVENTGNNTTSRLTPGSAILSGKITEVGGDYITYDEAGRQTRIEIGHNFAGAVATGYVPAGGGGGDSGGGSFNVSGSASASSGAAPPDPNNPNLSVEERMKLKRLQEQQKQKP